MRSGSANAKKDADGRVGGGRDSRAVARQRAVTQRLPAAANPMEEMVRWLLLLRHTLSGCSCLHTSATRGRVGNGNEFRSLVIAGWVASEDNHFKLRERSLPFNVCRRPDGTRRRDSRTSFFTHSCGSARIWGYISMLRLLCRNTATKWKS